MNLIKNKKVSKNIELEVKLREDWNKWQSKAHPEDRMSFIEYAEDLGVYKGYKIEINHLDDFNQIKFLMFTKE